METLGFIVELLILMIIVFTPIVCVCKNYSFVKLYLVSALIISLMLIVGAYCPHFFTEVRLDSMGFDFEGMSDAERVQNVAPEMREEATKLYWSNMGNGWPMKAIIWMVFLLPYPLIVWVFGLAYNKLKNRFGAKNT
ncbi:hypothetical protein [Colwellia sp. MB3u-55]|uniref:hypothetical protein n=1 Tax=Colwellia sp. MB3u-55 TaxID=2759810 RepID=UPI0015F4CAA4|nr:hypothetical protein [Colwellia sp. MB3u-55]MBA6254391.1 hypothetical protein [Colwellia sp. MB3u-55]